MSARRRLIVAGGGVAGLEGALALRATAGDLPTVDLICPEPEFIYRAMTVAEPFGYARPARIGFERLAHDRGVHHRRDTVASVDPAGRTVELGSGERLEFDALLVAVGARPQPWLDGALTFSGPDAIVPMRELLARIERGDVQDVVFTAPDPSWTLPIYELALLTSAWSADRGLPTLGLRVVTPETEPLEAFGAGATRLVRDLLSDRGIAIHAGATVTSVAGGRAQLSSGAAVEADAVVALPRITANPVPGLPTDADGFIRVDEHGRVAGTFHVYAAGDATTNTPKQGGLAAQQADVAATAIAKALGVAVDAPPYQPVLRGMLLTGVTSAFLRTGTGPDAAAFNALWWPPTKVAGRHLAAYVADVHDAPAPEDLADRPADLRLDLKRAAGARAEIRALALEMAEADARWEDYRSAARWLQTIEWLDGVLPIELARQRAVWLAKAGTSK